MIKTAKQQQAAMKKTKIDIKNRWVARIDGKINNAVSLGEFQVVVKVAGFVLTDVITHYRKRGYYCELTKKGLFVSWHESYVRVLDTKKKADKEAKVDGKK